MKRSENILKWSSAWRAYGKTYEVTQNTQQIQTNSTDFHNGLSETLLIRTIISADFVGCHREISGKVIIGDVKIYRGLDLTCALTLIRQRKTFLKLRHWCTKVELPRLFYPPPLTRVSPPLTHVSFILLHPCTREPRKRKQHTTIPLAGVISP